jgi:hypothetical protein
MVDIFPVSNKHIKYSFNIGFYSKIYMQDFFAVTDWVGIK